MSFIIVSTLVEQGNEIVAKHKVMEKDAEKGIKKHDERERSRVVKIKNIKKQNLLYGCFKNNPHKR